MKMTTKRRPLPGIRRLTGLLIVATTLSCCLWQQRVDALGTGAADCPGGRAAVGGGHLTGGFTQGTLDEGGITILMDGQPIKIDGSTTINFNVGQSHRITIEKTTYFRGFLFRLGGGILPPPADTITVFSTDSSQLDNPQVGLAAICVSKYGVGGVTHVNSNEKFSVSFYVTMQDAGSFMPIDITVVQDVAPSIFYYSSFLANSVGASSANSTTTLAPIPPLTTTTAPAPAPVAVPVAVPVPIPPPTLAPVLNVPAVPTTLQPVMVPAIPPTPSPTQSPIQPQPPPVQQQQPPTLVPAPSVPTVWVPPFMKPSTQPVAFIPPSLAPVLAPPPPTTLAPVPGPPQGATTLAPVSGPLPPGTIPPSLPIPAVPTPLLPTPVPTEVPKDSPADDSGFPTLTPTPTASPSVETSLIPTRTFTPTVLTYSLTEDFHGIQLTLDNVGSLDELAQLSFNEAMQSWYADYYFAEVEVEERRQRRRSLQEDGSMGGFTTNVTYTGQSTTDSSNTITYDQIVTYSPPSGDDRTGRDLILEPFNRLGSNRDLTATLRESNQAFEGLNSNGFIRPPTVPEATPRSVPAEGLGSGAIIGIAVGSAVFVAFGAFLIYRYVDSRSKQRDVDEKGNYDSGDDDAQPTSPARSAARSATSPGRASSSPAPVDEDAENATLLALQKTRSDEGDDDSLGNNQRRPSKGPQYNVTDTYGKVVDTSRDSSSSRRGVVVERHTIGGEDVESIETPLSNSGLGGALGAAAAAMGFSGTRNYSGNSPPANVREEIIYVTAPPGKLGVVIDTPSRDTPPIVHAVKEGSVLENEVLVGDKLLAVDDMDVSAMSAVRVSKLISRKSENATRKLTLMRETIEED